jgi:hypothetical protein
MLVPVPAHEVIDWLLEKRNLVRLAGGHGVACFALPGAVHAATFFKGLIENSAEIDATTRQHIAFVVFHGDRSKILRRVGGYTPHFEGYRVVGLSTSTDYGIEVETPEFSEDLGDAFRYEPHAINWPRFHHAMSDFTRAILDRFMLRHDVEPCLLFVDPERPLRHRVVSLDRRKPLGALFTDVLAAFRCF